MSIAEIIENTANSKGHLLTITENGHIGHTAHDNKQKNLLSGSRFSDIYIGDLCLPLRTLRPDTKVSYASQLIRSDPTLPGFCIVEENVLIGVTTRNQMTAKLSSQYGYSLYCNRGIENLMCRDFLCVDFQTPIDIVTKIAMLRDPEKIYDFITITRDGKYTGIVTVKDLLEKSMQIEIAASGHLKQCTELPAGPRAAKQVESCSYSQDKSCLLDFDIENFKSYNDVYGYDKGDIVMQSLSAILAKNIPEDFFVGHIGEEDYISVTSPDHADKMCRCIIEEFNKLVPVFYTDEDFIRGYIISKNNHDFEEIYPLMSLTIASEVNTSAAGVIEMPENPGKIQSICK